MFVLLATRFPVHKLYLLHREVFDIPLNRLPAYTAGGNNSLCDICTKKGERDEPAVVYCTHCCDRYCSKHQKV